MDSLEAAGGLITGGLIAKLLSRRENQRNVSTEDHSGVCSDCGAPVSGKYCSECGQPTHVHRFLLIPLSIPFVALLFLWRRGFTLYDHGVFVLYSLTAMSILVMVTSILAPIRSGFGVLSGLAFAFGVPAHMFAKPKGAYQLSWFSAAWRTMLLLIFGVFALTAFVVSIIMLGLAG
jgi:hypothetical protein